MSRIAWDDLSNHQKNTLTRLAERGPSDTSTRPNAATVNHHSAIGLLSRGLVQKVPFDLEDNHGGIIRIALTSAGAELVRSRNLNVR